MNRFFLVLFIVTIAVSCSTLTRDRNSEILNQAETGASSSGKRILETSRTMIEKQEIIVGGCWNYINSVFLRAGFGDKQRETIFKSKLQGPYLQDDIIEAGDWLYFVNHTYHDTEHSAIFVAWTNKDKKEALMVNYVGEKKKKPAFYKKFVLDKVYNLIRARDEKN